MQCGQCAAGYVEATMTPWATSIYLCPDDDGDAICNWDDPDYVCFDDDGDGICNEYDDDFVCPQDQDGDGICDEWDDEVELTPTPHVSPTLQNDHYYLSEWRNYSYTAPAGWMGAYGPIVYFDPPDTSERYFAGVVIRENALWGTGCGVSDGTMVSWPTGGVGPAIDSNSFKWLDGTNCWDGIIYDAQGGIVQQWGLPCSSQGVPRVGRAATSEINSGMTIAVQARICVDAAGSYIDFDYAFIWYGVEPTPTPIPSFTPTATPTNYPGYCGEVMQAAGGGSGSGAYGLWSDSELGLTRPQFRVGVAKCYGIGETDILDILGLDLYWPGLEVCFTPFSMGEIQILDIFIDADMLLAVMAGVMLLRWVLRS